MPIQPEPPLATGVRYDREVNRAELVAAVAYRTGMDPATVDHAIGGFADQILCEMAHGGSVNIRNFGKFTARRRAALRRVHPTSGEEILVPPQMTVAFTPSSTMKERLNQ